MRRQRKKKLTWKTAVNASTKHFARIRPQTTRILFRVFQKLLAERVIQKFSFKTVFSYEDRRVKKKFRFRMHGIDFCMQFVPSRRSIIDHENNDSRFLVIALPKFATERDIRDVITRDVATWDMGFGLEKLVESAFSGERKPSWCKKYIKGTPKQDKKEGIDCIVVVDGGSERLRGELRINIKQRQKNFASDHSKHIKRYPGVHVLDLPYPAGVEFIHEGVYAIAKAFLVSKKTKQ